MRSSSLFLTLAYAAAMVMARPTIRAEPEPVPEVADVTSSPISYISCNKPGVFALTFDDGPAQYSWGLAKTLHDEGIRATFFINGNNAVNVLADSTTTEEGEKTYLEVIKQYYDQGHEIGSHTYEHKNLVDMTVEEVEYQMNTQSDIIFKAIGKRPALMRPPEGETDEVSDKVLKDLGYHNVLWDIDTNDWRKLGLAAQQKEVNNVLDDDVANVTNGHISLEHDIHEDTVTTLVPWLTKYVKSKGYTFVPISECIGVEPYQPDENSSVADNTTLTDASAANSTLTAEIILDQIDIDLTNL